MKNNSLKRYLMLGITSTLFLIITTFAVGSPQSASARGDKRLFLPFIDNGGAATQSCNPKVPNQTSPDEGFEKSVLTLINKERSKVGAPALSASPSLTQLARFHSNDMATSGVFSHSGSKGDSFGERISWGCDRYSYAGEIIAAGHASPEQVVQGWLTSPPHKAILLDPIYKVAGVGFARSQGSEAYWTVDFITPVR